MNGFTLDRFDVEYQSFGSRDFSLGPDAQGLDDAIHEEGSLVASDGSQEDLDADDDTQSEAEITITERLSQLMSDIQQQWLIESETAIRDVADTAGRSVAAMLPNFVDSFGSRQLSASVVAVLERAKPDSPELLLSCEDHDSIVETLSELNSQIPLKVRKSAGLQSGKVSLKWNHGGADLDMSDFLNAAKIILESEQSIKINGVPTQ